MEKGFYFLLDYGMTPETSVSVNFSKILFMAFFTKLVDPTTLTGQRLRSQQVTRKDPKVREQCVSCEINKPQHFLPEPRTLTQDTLTQDGGQGVFLVNLFPSPYQ